jgi:hypothetical protein
MKEYVIGFQYGWWTVIADSAYYNKHRYVIVQCRCGTEREVSLQCLKRGNTLQCGCAGSFPVDDRPKPVGTYYLYVLHYDILRRCRKSSGVYATDDVHMYEPWVDDPDAFVQWILENLGHKPTIGYSLDRIDNKKGYVPGNLRWATPKQQQRNREDTRYVVLGGVRATLCDLADRFGLDSGVLRGRLDRGWSVKEALFTKLHDSIRYKENHPDDELPEPF